MAGRHDFLAISASHDLERPQKSAILDGSISEILSRDAAGARTCAPNLNDCRGHNARCQGPATTAAPAADPRSVCRDRVSRHRRRQRVAAGLSTGIGLASSWVMNPASVRNLLLSLGLATGIAGAADGCSSQSPSTPPGGTGGSPNIGGFCGNCMGQNLSMGGSGGHLDAASEASTEAGGETPPVQPADAQAGDAEGGGG